MACAGTQEKSGFVGTSCMLSRRCSDASSSFLVYGWEEKKEDKRQCKSLPLCVM